MIEFTRLDLDKLNKIAYDFRPKILDDYKKKFSLNPQDKILLFLNSYIFLIRLRDNISDSILEGKLNTVLYKYNKLYKKALELIKHMDSKLNFGKAELLLTMGEFVNKYHDEIELIYNFAFPVGKKVKLYDPNRFGGVVE